MTKRFGTDKPALDSADWVQGLLSQGCGCFSGKLRRKTRSTVFCSWQEWEWIGRCVRLFAGMLLLGLGPMPEFKFLRWEVKFNPCFLGKKVNGPGGGFFSCAPERRLKRRKITFRARFTPTDPDFGFSPGGWQNCGGGKEKKAGIVKLSADSWRVLHLKM